LFQHDLMVENAPDYSADGFVVPKIASWPHSKHWPI
jgi:hypothetical protein